MVCIEKYKTVCIEKYETVCNHKYRTRKRGKSEIVFWKKLEDEQLRGHCGRSYPVGGGEGGQLPDGGGHDGRLLQPDAAHGRADV